MIYQLAYEKKDVYLTVKEGNAFWSMNGTVHLAKRIKDDFEMGRRPGLLCGKGGGEYLYGEWVRGAFAVSCEKCRAQAELEALTNGTIV